MIGGKHGAAGRLGLPRTTLIYKMRKLGIEMRRCARGRSAPKEARGWHAPQRAGWRHAVVNQSQLIDRFGLLHLRGPVRHVSIDWPRPVVVSAGRHRSSSGVHCVFVFNLPGLASRVRLQPLQCNESAALNCKRLPLLTGAGAMPALGFGTLIPDPQRPAMPPEQHWRLVSAISIVPKDIATKNKLARRFVTLSAPDGSLARSCSSQRSYGIITIAPSAWSQR